MGALVVLSLVSPIAAEVDVYLFLVVQLLKGCAGVSHLKFDLASQNRSSPFLSLSNLINV